MEWSDWAGLVLSPAGAVPTGAARGGGGGGQWAEEHFPVRAGGQRLMGQVSGRGLGGVVEEVTLLSGAKSV